MHLLARWFPYSNGPITYPEFFLKKGVCLKKKGKKTYFLSEDKTLKRK